MSIFKRRQNPSQETFGYDDQDGMQFDWSAKSDPAVPSNVRAQWSLTDEDENNWGAWQNGMRLYETGPVLQRFNAAEYMSRGFCQLLDHPDAIGDAEVATTIERMLTALNECPIPADIYAEVGGKCIRLAMTILKQRGWQPSYLGGDETIAIELDTDRIRASLSTDDIPPETSLEHFFEVQ